MPESELRKPRMTPAESWCGYAIKSTLYKAYPILARKKGIFKYYECKSGTGTKPVCKTAEKKLNPWGVGTFGGGRHENTADRKPRAADVYLDSHNEDEERIGNEIMNKLLQNAARLRVKYVTWNNWVYYPDGSKTPLSSKWAGSASGRHENHLHVEFTDQYNSRSGIVEAFTAVFPAVSKGE